MRTLHVCLLWWHSNGLIENFKFDRMTDNDLHMNLKPGDKVFSIN